jgi:hypothetical protein
MQTLRSRLVTVALWLVILAGTVAVLTACASYFDQLAYYRSRPPEPNDRYALGIWMRLLFVILGPLVVLIGFAVCAGLLQRQQAAWSVRRFVVLAALRLGLLLAWVSLSGGIPFLSLVVTNANYEGRLGTGTLDLQVLLMTSLLQVFAFLGAAVTLATVASLLPPPASATDSSLPH